MIIDHAEQSEATKLLDDKTPEVVSFEYVFGKIAELSRSPEVSCSTASTFSSTYYFEASLG